jgi:putative oxidoreductase
MKLKSLFSSASLNIDLGILLLRITVGLTMAFYGYQKLVHYNEMVVEDFWQNDVSLFGMKGAVPLSLTIFAEFFCSLLLILGVFTRMALFFLLFCMGYIAFYMDGFELISSGDNGLEMNSAFNYFMLYVGLLFTGSGKYSVDALLMKRKN